MSRLFKAIVSSPPTGTHQDFLLRISSLQAEGKTLATDPRMDNLGPAQAFLAWDAVPWHRSLEGKATHHQPPPA